MACSRPIYEGDTVLLYCQSAKGYVFSRPPSSSYSRFSIHSKTCDVNVHSIAFQVLPEYFNVNLRSFSPVSVSKPDGKTSCLHQTLVYGRKIKLLHVGSRMYLSVPVMDSDTKLAVLGEFNDSCLLKILPSPTGDKREGDLIYPDDEVIFESVQRKGYYIVCVSNPLIDSFELKGAISVNSVFSIRSQTISDKSISHKDIRGGSVVTFKDVRNIYLCGTGCTVAHILPDDLECDGQLKACAKNRKQLSVPQPPPSRGDCWWQLLKANNPLDGSSFSYEEECYIKHMPTQRYLAVDRASDNLVLETMSEIKESEIKEKNYNYIFFIKPSDDVTGKVTKKSIIRLADSLKDDCRYITITGTQITDTAGITFSYKKLLTLKLSGNQTEGLVDSYVINEVEPADLHDLYYVESVKHTLAKYLQEMAEFPVLDELLDALYRLLEWLKKGSEDVAKVHSKMLLNSNVIDLLVGFLALSFDERSFLLKKLFKGVCDVLKVYAEIKSSQSHKYLSKKSFLRVFSNKLQEGVGVEAFLTALVEDESDTAKDLVDFFINDGFPLKRFSELEAASLNLLSALCFTGGQPVRNLQNIICRHIIMTKEGFYWTDIQGNTVYCYKTDRKEDEKPLTDLCSVETSTEDPEFMFFIAQLRLFSSVCKGVNKTSIEIISKKFPIEQALVVLKDVNIHTLAKSAYLQLVISVYLDEAIENSGIDIHGMWHCYLWERLIPAPPNRMCQPLEGANVKSNLVEDLPNSQEIKQLMDVIKDGIKNANKHLCLANEYLDQMLAVIEPMAAYGYFWNVGSGEQLFNVDKLIEILDGHNDFVNATDPDGPDNKAYQMSGRFKRKPEHVALFRIKTRILKVLRIFFEQFIYLALEQFLYDFSRRKNALTVPHDFIHPSNAIILEENITRYLATTNILQANRFHAYALESLQRHFVLEGYQCFQDGQKLVQILLDLMNYDDEDLSSTSAALLFDIYNKEHIMFAQAEESYIVKDDRDAYDDFISRVTFRGDGKIFQSLLQGNVDKAAADEIKDTVEIMQFTMLLNEAETDPCKLDETLTDLCVQDTAFTTGLFSLLMTYVLKSCPTCETEQSGLLQSILRLLQLMCRRNDKIQRKIHENWVDFMHFEMCVCSVARLLTETMTNNVSLCHEVIDGYLVELFSMACKCIEPVDKAQEYLEFFTTLEVIMKPYKMIGPPLVIHQKTVVGLLSDSQRDLFGDLTVCSKKLEVLKNSSNDDKELLKLLHLASLLATCCDESHQFAVNVCTEVFSLTELVNILSCDDIVPERKIPFARLLAVTYVRAESESIASVHYLLKSQQFWDHIHACTEQLRLLIEESLGDQVKLYLRKISALYLTWNEIFSVNGGTNAHFILQYFIEGLGPLVAAFCEQLAIQKERNLTKNRYERIVNSAAIKIQELGATIAVLLDRKKSLLTTNEVLCCLWKRCFDSINSVFPVAYTLTEFHFSCDVSPGVKAYLDKMSEQLEINRQFQQFVGNYRKIFTWKRKHLRSHNSYEKLRDSEGLLPGGPTFLKLVELFDIPITEQQQLDLHTQESSYILKADVKRIDCLMNLLGVVYHLLGRQLTSKDRTKYFNTFKYTLQALFGIMYTRIENIDAKHWEKGYVSRIEPIQIALATKQFTQMKEFMKQFSQVSLKCWTDLTDTIVIFTSAFMYTLVFNGNETTQNMMFNVIREDPSFFMAVREWINKVTLELNTVQTRHNRTSHLVERRVSTGSQDHFQTHLSNNGSEYIQLKERVLSSCSSATDAQKEPLDAHVKDTLWYVGIAFDLVSAFCDGQNRDLQNFMRNQHFTVDVISEVAMAFRTFAEVQVLDQKSIVPVTTKAIQALIEMCAGNCDNQQIALNGQVVDAINLTLTCPCSDIDVILMQCKAIELLEVLIEKTSKESDCIIEAVLRNLSKDKMIEFIKVAYEIVNKMQDKMDCRKRDFTGRKERIQRNMFKAYHVLRSLADFAQTQFFYFILPKEVEFDMWKALEDRTCSIEVNYITKDKQEILTRVYFPFELPRKLSESEKFDLQDGLNRDAPEDKVKDLLEWTDSTWKIDQHKERLKKYFIYQPLLAFHELRHWALIILTIILNIFVLAVFEVPSYTCDRDNSTNSSNTPGLILIPNPAVCWSEYQFYILYILGFLHIILSLWMTLEYFVQKAPNFVFQIPFIQWKLYRLKDDMKHNWRRLFSACTWLNNNLFRGYLELNRPQMSQCFDINFFSIYPIYRIFFFVCSVLAIGTYGYFYCFCLPYIFIEVRVLQHVVKAVGGRAKQLIYVALLIFVLLLIYGVLSFAVISSFFDLNQDFYCRTLWECYVTVMRVGLLDTLGDSLPVRYVGQSGNDFGIYMWRSAIDLSFFVVISLIMLEIVTAILVDRFSELRAERDAALKDQKDLCYVCGISNDTFEREGAKGKGFWEHYHEDHNLYNYIYYGIHVRSMAPQDHNAIEKYVYDQLKKKAIAFYPLRKALVLGGTVTTETTKLVEDIKKVIEKSEKAN